MGYSIPLEPPATPLDKTGRVLPTLSEGTGWGIRLLPWEQLTPSSCSPSPHFPAILGKCTDPCVRFPGESPFPRIRARKKGWDAASLSPNKRVLPAHSGLPSRSCIFLAVAHPYTWRLHYLCSEFPSCSKTLLSWELLPHPQTLTRAPKAPFYSMTRFLESAWSSASCPELVYCGLRPLPWESRPFLSTEEPVSTYFLAGKSAFLRPWAEPTSPFYAVGAGWAVGVGGNQDLKRPAVNHALVWGGPPPSSSLILPHPP